MYDKYRDYTIYEIENGWLLRIDKPLDIGKTNNELFTTTFYKDKLALLKALEKEL